MFVGFSNQHSLLVPLVLNLQTNKISPQYHVLFDNKFQMVTTSLTSSSSVDALCCGADLFLNPDFTGDIEPYSLGDKWLDPDVSLCRKEHHSQHFLHTCFCSFDVSPSAPVALFDNDPSPSKRWQVCFGDDTVYEFFPDFKFWMPSSHDESPSSVLIKQETEGEVAVDSAPPAAVSEGVDPPLVPSADSPPVSASVPPAPIKPCYPQCNCGPYWKSGPAKDCNLTKWATKASIYALATVCLWGQPPLLVLNNDHCNSSFHAAKRVPKAFLADLSLLHDTWDDVHTAFDTRCLHGFSAIIEPDP